MKAEEPDVVNTNDATQIESLDWNNALFCRVLQMMLRKQTTLMSPRFHEAIPHNYRSFNDKLTPVRRWMDKQVGRVWDDVHSELRTRFDSRTIAGQHILFDHMLNDVDPHPYVTKYSLFGVGSYFVDEEGILRKRAEFRRHYRVEKRTVSESELIAWRGDRYVREVGNELFWLDLVRQASPLTLLLGDGPTYRQGNKLSKSERAFYNRLKDFEKRLVQLPEKK